MEAIWNWMRGLFAKAESRDCLWPLEVYVDGARRPDLDRSPEPNIAVCRVCCETGKAAYANVDGNRVEIRTVEE